MSREAPEPWASAMIAAGLTDPRNGRASMTALAEAVGSHASTVSAMMYGERKTRHDLIVRVAAALRMTDRVDVVASWAHQARRDVTPFQPHPDADLLTPPERKAVNELIRLLAAPKREDVMGNAEHPAAIGATESGEPKPARRRHSPLTRQDEEDLEEFERRQKDESSPGTEEIA